jgi:hypothetical protein
MWNPPFVCSIDLRAYVSVYVTIGGERKHEEDVPPDGGGDLSRSRVATVPESGMVRRDRSGYKEVMEMPRASLAYS